MTRCDTHTYMHMYTQRERQTHRRHDIERAQTPTHAYFHTQALRDAKISKADVVDVVLVGGSAHIPKVQSLLQQFFNGKKPRCSISPETVVAHGAAIQASILAGTFTDLDSNPPTVVHDVTHLSLGVEASGGLMAVVVPRNTFMPCRMNRTFSTNTDGQSGVVIRIFEGQRPLTKHCKHIGTLRLDGFAPMPRGAPLIQIIFDYDANDTLHVRASEVSTSSQAIMHIHLKPSRHSVADLKHIYREAEEHEAEDRAQAARVQAKNALEDTLHSIRDTINNGGSMSGKIQDVVTAALSDTVDKAFKWMGDKGAILKTTDEYEAKSKQVEAAAKPLLQLVGTATGRGGATREGGADGATAAASSGSADVISGQTLMKLTNL